MYVYECAHIYTNIYMYIYMYMAPSPSVPYPTTPALDGHRTDKPDGQRGAGKPRKPRNQETKETGKPIRKTGGARDTGEQTSAILLRFALRLLLICIRIHPGAPGKPGNHGNRGECQVKPGNQGNRGRQGDREARETDKFSQPKPALGFRV